MDFLLGVSGGPRGSHEPGIALIDEAGQLSYVFEEERFNRFKSSISCFPTQALKTLLPLIDLSSHKITHFSSPGLTYEDMHQRWPLYLNHNFNLSPAYKSYHHQLCHAASAFYSSPFEDALIVTLDGIGDRCSGMIAVGKNDKIHPKKYLPLSSSVGQFWALMCQYIGYDGLEDAYKTMGLAPYGNPIYDLSDIFSYDKESFRLDESYILRKYDFVSKHPSEPVYSDKFPPFLSGNSRRRSVDPLSEREYDIAASAQHHIESILLEFFGDLRQKYSLSRLCFAGGVALNSHFNGLLQESNLFDHIYIPPYAGDSGLAVGASQLLYSDVFNKRPQPLDTPYKGSSYDDEFILRQLEDVGVSCRESDVSEVASLIYQGDVIGFYQGPSECGPRALGARSILANPCLEGMKDVVNKKIKYREHYRPFAPVTLADHLHEYFNIVSADCSYMSFAVNAYERTRRLAPEIVHVDNTSRVQSVDASTPLGELLVAFNKLSNVPILLNTSFNLKGEPNVESPRDALRTFYSSGLDHLYIGKYLVSK